MVVPWSGRSALFLAVMAFALTSAAGVKANTDGGPDSFVELVEASRLGDVPTVKRLLAAGMNVNQRDGSTYQYPALFHALNARQFDTARVLIEAGADLKNLRDRKAYALVWAAEAGDAGIVRLMLKQGVAPNARWEDARYGYFGRLPIEEALEWGRLDVIKELEKAGVSWQGNTHGAYALSLVGKSGRVDCADYLMSKGADVNTPYDGNLILDGAAARGDLALVKLLLAKGAKVNAVSQGVSDLKDWAVYQRTALVSAVINSQLEVVRLLLQSGADPKALDNLAIKWADMMGDSEAYDLLRKAGAPDPGPFAYREWLHLNPVAGLAPLEDVRKNKTLSAPLPTWSSLKDGGPAPAFGRPTKIAIITLGSDLDNAESLLSAKLSAVDRAVVLERSGLKAILKERALTRDFGSSPGENIRLGQLVGADALVILRTYPIEGRRVIESRIVSVATGLVTSMVPFELDNARLSEWSDLMAARCAADGALLFTPPQEARLVAVAPFTASVNTVEARDLERQLGALVVMRLAQLPGVFVVEREMLDRLQAEGRPEDKVLLNGSWLVSGSVEKSLNDGGASLRLAFKPGGGGASRGINVGGDADQPVKLAEEAVKQAAVVLNTAPVQPWDPAEESAAYLKQGEAFFARRMWAEAEMAAGAAWALGLHDDRVVHLRMSAATSRIKFSAFYYSAAKRKTHDLSGVLDLMSYRVPLLLPPEDDRELAVDDYLEQANLILDLLEQVIARPDAEMAGVPYEMWLCGQQWDAATLALQVTEALSYRRDYGDQLDALRARLLDLSSMAIQQARARKNAKLLHTMMALRCKNLAWWVKGDAAFQTEALGLLRGAKGWAPPASEHAIWGPVLLIAKEHMHKTSGRASQSWVRLAEVMAQSDDVRERYLGTGLIGMERGGKAQIEQTIDLLMKDFPALVELDRSIPARVWAIGYKTGVDPGEGGSFECWYPTVLEQARTVKMAVAGSLGNTIDDWKPKSNDDNRKLPEVRQFLWVNGTHRLDLICSRGPSGYFLSSLRNGGLTISQKDRLIELCRQAKAKFDPLVQTYPEVKDAIFGLSMTAGEPPSAASAQSGKGQETDLNRLVLSNPRLAFEQEVSRLSPEDKKSTKVSLGVNNLWGPGPKRLYIGKAAGKPVVYSFNADGGTTVMIEAPAVAISGYETRLNPIDNGRADLNDRYLVCDGNRYFASDDRVEYCIWLYDIAGRRWQALFPPQAYKYIYDTKIFGDKLVYTFLYNPVIDAAGSKSSDDYEKRGDPLRGVMEYDLKSGKYELLASNRRNPVLSPIDGPDKKYEKFVRISDEEFSVSGSDQQVFNVKTGAWRARTGDDQAKARMANGNDWDYCEASGTSWGLMFNRSTKMLVCRNRKKSTQVVQFSVEFTDTGFVERLKSYEECVRYYLAAKKSGMIEVKTTPGGVVFTVGSAYFWVPKEHIVSMISRALAPPPEVVPVRP